MNVRQQLQKVRQEYEAMSVLEVVLAAEEMGIEVDVDMTRELLIDMLMAAEEHAAFH